MPKQIVNNDNLHKVLVLQNPNTTEEHLKKLLKNSDYDWVLLHSTLNNPNLSLEFLEYLVPFCSAFSLAAKLARCVNATDELRLLIIKQSDPYAARLLAESTLKTEITKRRALMIMSGK